MVEDCFQGHLMLVLLFCSDPELAEDVFEVINGLRISGHRCSRYGEEWSLWMEDLRVGACKVPHGGLVDILLYAQSPVLFYTL